jgi:sec-independent protein translocase protein TatC
MRLLPRRLSPGQQASAVDHLGELRARLAVCVAALAAGSVLGYLVHGELLRLLEQPLPAEHRRLVVLGVSEAFTTALKLSVLAGFLLALPVILWQVWSFLAPALPDGTRRSARGLFALASGLLGAGVTFAYAVVLPAALGFLTTFDEQAYDTQLRAGDYLSFVTLVLVAVGIVFELPVFVLGLVRLGALRARTLRRNRRIGYLAVAVVAVALPGIDPVTTTLEALPLFALYEASIWLAVLLERRLSLSDRGTRGAPA